MDDLSKKTKTYHHGDLRRALLDAAEAELIEKGAEKFSLRGIAKRAGVSHAAPAHHFKDVNGLLTSLTAISFKRFHEAMQDASNEIGDDPYDKLVAIGMAYIHYAESNQAMFDLQFTSNRIDHCSPEIEEYAPLSYQCLVTHVLAVLVARGKTLDQLPDAPNSYWALCHGLAALFARNRQKMGNAPPETINKRFEDILRNAAHSF